MPDLFMKAFETLLELEGGYVNDPNDPGGETKYGISKRAYPYLDIKNLTKQQAAEIYRRDYWEKASCNKLPSPLAEYVFDCAVNSGVKSAIMQLQETCNVKADGVIGPQTLFAARNTDPDLFLADRAMFYASLKQFDRYGRGWLKRLFKQKII